MNASLHQTFAQVTRALATLTAEPVVADLLDWERAQAVRPYRTIEFAMRFYCLIGADLTEPLADVKDRLRKAIARERLKASKGHRSFCPIRLAAFADMTKVIEQFEREAA